MADLLDRRRLLKAGGVGALAFTLNGCDIELSPRDAKRLGAEFKSLSQDEVAILEKLGDVLLPGAKDAGLAYYLDAQLSAEPKDSLLLLRYMDWPWEQHAAFYKSGAAALNALAQEAKGAPFADLDDEAATALIGEIAGSQPASWASDAPPAPLFYFVARADAVDVVWGTQEGFEALDAPYFEHILPSSKW